MTYGLYKTDTNELLATSPGFIEDAAEGLECREVVEAPPPGDPLRLADPAWEDEKSWTFLKDLFLTEFTHEVQPTKEGQDRDAVIAGIYLAKLKGLGVDPASKEVMAQREKILKWHSGELEGQKIQATMTMLYASSKDQVDMALDRHDKLVADQSIVANLLTEACKWPL